MACKSVRSEGKIFFVKSSGAALLQTSKKVCFGEKTAPLFRRRWGSRVCLKYTRASAGTLWLVSQCGMRGKHFLLNRQKLHCLRHKREHQRCTVACKSVRYEEKRSFVKSSEAGLPQISRDVCFGEKTVPLSRQRWGSHVPIVQVGAEPGLPEVSTRDGT